MFNGPEIWMLLAGLIVLVVVIAGAVALGIRLASRGK